MKHLKTTILSLLTIATVSVCSAQTPTSTGTNSGQNGGSQSSYYGLNSGQVSTGANNTFIGANTGSANSIGKENTFLGSNSGRSNTSGHSNVFLGYDAGLNNIKGKHNVTIGHSAGSSSRIANYNTLLGYAAGRDVEGDYNTMIGRESGLNGTGKANVFIGNQAGKNATGSNNVFLGNRAGENETGNHKLYIANSHANPPLIYGDFASDKLGINTNNPQAVFHIQKSSSPNLKLADSNNKTLEIGVSSGVGDFSSYAQSGDAVFRVLNGGNMIFSIPGTEGEREILFTSEGGNDGIMTVKEYGASGKVGIGTRNMPSVDTTENGEEYRLYVKGGIKAEEVKVELCTGQWCDYVFSTDYELKSLSDVNQHIQEYGYLHNSKSAKEIEAEGLELKDATINQQEKIEEIFLHLIEMDKRVKALEAENKVLKEQIKK